MRRRPAERRAFVVAAAIAVALHALFLDGAGFGPAPTRSLPASAVVVRTIVADARSAGPASPAPAPAPALPSPEPEVRRAPKRLAEQPPDAAKRSPAPTAKAIPDVAATAVAVAPAAAETQPEPESPMPAASEIPIAEAAPAGMQLAVEASAPSLVSSGESPPRDLGTPPPTYRVLLPPPLTARYEVRRGFLRGTGQIVWQPDGDSYAMRLEARVGSLVLLVQSSVGSIGEFGLAPRRYVDQRMRRSAQAANFDADAGKVTFSGPPTTWPLYPGTQDRLSLFVQLAGIAAADPSRLVDGAIFPMVVVGARGDAAVWMLRVAGREAVETAAGPVQAIKVVRDARGPSDTVAEIWLDPGHHYLPAHATLRTTSGASEYDLLLEGVSSGR